MEAKRRWTPILVMVAAVVSVSLEAKIAEFWQDLPAMPRPRQEVGVAALEPYIYVVGGIGEDRAPSGFFDRFNVETNEWEELPPLPDGVRLHHVGAASVHEKIFVIGGLNNSFRGVASVYEYDPATNLWTEKTGMDRARGAMGVAATEDRIYAAGGQSGGTSFNDFAVYHVAEDRWEDLPPMPTARNHLAAAIVDGVFYAVGGRAGGLRAQLEALPLNGKEWTTLAPMPTARAGIAAGVVDNWIFVFGGEGNINDARGIFSQVEGYDTCKNGWVEREPMPHPRHGIGAGVIRDLIYVPGGAPVEGFGVTDVNDVYFPGTLGPWPFDFRRGDSNRDRTVDISDAVFSLLALFGGGEPLSCEDAADSNDDGVHNIADPVYTLNFLFGGGPPPPEPGPHEPGPDFTKDSLDCDVPLDDSECSTVV